MPTLIPTQILSLIPSHTGTIDYHAFATWLHVGNDPNKLTKRFVHQMGLLGVRPMEDAFEKLNKTKITENNFGDLMIESFGPVMSKCELRALFSALDLEERGQITSDQIQKIVTKTKHGDDEEKDDKDHHARDKGDILSNPSY